MKAWFETSELRCRIGIITDHYLNYIELQDMETLEFHIVHESKVELIK
jgi:hypothetical protein